MAINTIGVTLKWGTTPITAKVVDIKDFPDIGGTPDTLDATSTSDTATSNILGLQSQSGMEFTCNYTKASYDLVKLDANADRYYALAFGNTEGSEGTFTWSGRHDVRLVGKGVNEVMEMLITVAPATKLVLAHVLTNVIFSGTVKQGTATSALTLTYTPVSPTPTPTLAYQWKKSATLGGTYTNIVGATSATYTPLAGDVGAYLKCQVTAGGSAVGTFLSNGIVVAGL